MGWCMRTNRVWALVLLLIVQTFAAGFAVIPSQSDTGEWQGPVQFADARSNNTTDSDNDGIVDSYDACPNGQTNWTSSASTDHDSDGCQDSSEDLDDDNDGVADINDACMVGDLGWTSTNLTDYDSDGCRDWSEDLDDDNDGVVDFDDACSMGELGWISSNMTDADGDGCKDATEDPDGGTGGNSSSGCGNDPTYTSLYAYSSLSNYYVNDTFTGIMNVYCQLTNITMTLDYSILDSSNTSVDSGNMSWVGGSSNYTYEFWNTTLNQQGMYGFYAILGYYDANQTWIQVDTDYDSFTVWNQTSGGGNNTGGCGDDPTYASLYAYSYSSLYYVNDTFTGFMDIYCSLTNMTMTLDYSILDSSNTTVDSGNMSWIGSSSTYTYEFWNTTVSQAGNYTFEAVLGYYDANQTWTQLDSDYDYFTVLNQTSGGGNNTGGCGDDPTYASLYAYSYSSLYYVNDTFTGFMDIYCSLTNMTMTLDYFIVDASNTTVAAGNMSWIGSSSTYTSEFWNTTLTQAGNYTFEAFLGYYDTNQTWTQLDSDYDFFTVWNQNSGGGNNSGNEGNNSSPGASITIESNGEVFVMGDILQFSIESSGLNLDSNYTLMLNNSLTGASTTYTWNASMSSSFENFNTTALTNGTFCFDAYLFENINGSSVLVGMDTVCVTVGMSDMDQDMISDSQDNCPTIYNPNQSDLDNDGKGDLCDDDMDGDSVPNAQDAFPMDGDESVDTDGDGIGNNADTDDDGDGLNDADDAFPLDANEQTDLDGDNVGDNADADDDNDGVVDSIDNCPFVANPDQADGNANGIGTVCDSSEDTTGGETGGNNTGGNNTGNNTGGETGGNNTGGETGGNNTGGETGGNETSSTDDESIPALGALGTMVAMTVGFMAASRRFDDA